MFQYFLTELHMYFVHFTMHLLFLYFLIIICYIYILKEGFLSFFSAAKEQKMQRYSDLNIFIVTIHGKRPCQYFTNLRYRY